MTSTASPVTSLREIATCVGLDGTFKVVRDFFGYDTGPPEQLSLKRQFELMNEHYVNINVILVGVESFAHAERAEIDSAIAFMRRALAAVNFGIGPVRWFHIDTDEAAGREHIASDGEAKDLTREWTVHNYAIDVFFVLTYAGSTVGSAPRHGPEDKDIHRMSGVVLAIEGSPTVTGNVLAREVCRYLGLKDSDTDNNLMFPSVPNGAHLTREQRDDLMPTTNGWPPFLNMPCWYEGPWVHW